MKITATYSELEVLISDKTGRKINMKYGGNPDDIIVKCIGIPYHLHIERIEKPSIIVSYHIGDKSNIAAGDVPVAPCSPTRSFLERLFRRGTKAIENKAANVFVENFVKHPAVSVNPDKTLTVALDKIPQLGNVLEKISLSGISFNEEGATADVSFVRNER